MKQICSVTECKIKPGGLAAFETLYGFFFSLMSISFTCLFIFSFFSNTFPVFYSVI